MTYLFQDPADEANLLDNCVSQMKAYMEHLKNNDSGCVQSNLFMRIFSAYINQDPFFRNFRNITDLCFLHSDLLFFIILFSDSDQYSWSHFKAPSESDRAKIMQLAMDSIYLLGMFKFDDYKGKF